MRRFVGYVFVLLLANTALAQRLPRIAVPENYNLTLTPDLSKAAFSGEETIRVRVLQPTAQLVLSSADIAIQEAAISNDAGTQSATVSFDNTKEAVTLAVAKALSVGAATIRIKYTGILNNEMRGFYLGKDTDGRPYASTQFEVNDARRAFPSFDEPAYKATFDITIIAEKGLTAISNNKAVSDVPGPADKHTVKFATTAKISSYLAAWSVGNFEYIEGAADGIPVRVYTTPGKKDLGRLALEASEYSLKYFDHYFGIKYPYGKLDLIALPDFSAGAMENVGLITSREAMLLADDHASLALKKAVGVTVTHEIAHQWFGDLVTMQWWDDVWLNEGFATWMEGKPMDAWKPEWNVGLDEVSRGDVLTTLGALNVDSLTSTRPIHQPAETNDQIQELFDGIAYGKAAAVLRMLEAYLGPETFRTGVSAYLKKYAYSNSTAADFWNTLAAVSKKPVNQIMPTFVNQPGVPMVSVTVQCVGRSTKLGVEQQRYFYDRAALSAGNDQLWQIPICVKRPGVSANRCELLTRKQDTFTLPGCSEWVLANGGANGYYRSGYQPEAVRALASHAATALTPLERIGLLTDTWAAVRVARQPIGDYLTLAQGLQSDRTDAVLNLVFGQLAGIGNNVVSESDQAAYQAWVRQLLIPIVRDVGWEARRGESEDRKSLRANLLTALGNAGHDPDAIAEARKLADQALHDPSSVESGLAGAALTVAAADGDSGLYDMILAATKTAKTPEQYYLYLFTLTAFRDPQLVQRTLELTISPEVRSQDSLSVLGAVMGNPAAHKEAWEFVRSHWPQVERAGGPSPAHRSKVVPVSFAILACVTTSKTFSRLTRSPPPSEP